MNTEEFVTFPIDDFLADIQRLMDEKTFYPFYLILGTLNDHVQVVTAPVVSLTIYGREVKNPERYIDIIEDLKDHAIKNIFKNKLALVQKYIDDHGDSKEAEFLSRLISRINKDATAADYYEILNSAKDAIKNMSAQPKRKFLTWTAKNKENDFFLACNNLIACVENIIDECLKFEYLPDAKGKISTSTFKQWIKKPNHLDASAINDPGATLKDITRDVKIGEKGIYDFELAVIQEDEKMKVEAERRLNNIFAKIEDPPLLNAAAKLLGISIDELKQGKARLTHLQNMIKQIPISGNPEASEIFNVINDEIFLKKEELAQKAGHNIPGHFEKKRLIKILRALDNGLLLGDACAALYREYEAVYDMCHKLISVYPNFKKELDEILQAAKALLLAHSRDLPELIKVGDVYQVKEPKVIINQVVQAQEILLKNLNKLHHINGASDLGKSIMQLLHERAEVVKKYPEKVAVKEELLSVKQNVQNGLYLLQVKDCFSLKGHPVAPAAPESQKTAIIFDGEGGAFIQLEIQQGKFAVEGGMFALNPNSQLFQIETGKEPRKPDLLSTNMKVHFTAVQKKDAGDNTVPEVDVSLTELKFTRATRALEFDPKVGKGLEEDVELVSRSTLNASR